jgi:hypothetical protein
MKLKNVPCFPAAWIRNAYDLFTMQRHLDNELGLTLKRNKSSILRTGYNIQLTLRYNSSKDSLLLELAILRGQ